MRKPWTLAVGSLLAAACSGETVAQPPPAPVDWRSFQAHAASDAGARAPTMNERAVAESYIAAVASPGLSRLAALLDEDAHFASPGMHDAHGRDSIVHDHEMLFGAFDQRAVVATRVWRTESAQTVEWTMTGTQGGSWMGIASTGKSVTFKGLTILWTKADGSITDLHVYFDTAVVKAQLGVGPKALVKLPLPVREPSVCQVFDQTGSFDEKNGVSLYRAALDALENKNLDGYLANMADDVEVSTFERAMPMRGKEDLRASFREMHRAIGELDTTLDNAWGIARFAVVEYTVAGEQMAPIGWIPVQRENVVRLHVVDVVEIRDAKIARVWRYDNPSEITTVL